MYSREKSPVPLKELRLLYNELPEEKVKRYYNLHYLIKKDVPRDKWLKGYDEPGLKIYAQYFLEYGVDSFTRAHTDNDNVIVKTSITLVDAVNLEGGEIIVYEPHYKKDMEVTPDVLNRYKEGDYHPGEEVIPIVVKQEVGEVINYAPHVKHAVSKVEKGTRLVFVVWYQKG